MKKKMMMLLVICLVVLVTACDKEDNYKVVKCVRNVEATSDLEVEANYYLYYEGDYIKKMESKEVVKASTKSILNTYKSAYEKSYSPYKDIEYYDNKITIDGNTLTSEVNIDYTKVDIDKLIELEGEKDNIYEDGKVSLKKALDLYDEAGLQCDK